MLSFDPDLDDALGPDAEKAARRRIWELLRTEGVEAWEASQRSGLSLDDAKRMIAELEKEFGTLQ